MNDAAYELTGTGPTFAGAFVTARQTRLDRNARFFLSLVLRDGRRLRSRAAFDTNAAALKAGKNWLASDASGASLMLSNFVLV